MVQAVMEGKVADANAVLGCDAAFQKLTAQSFKICQQEQVRCLYNILDCIFVQPNLQEYHKYFTLQCMYLKPKPLTY